MTAACWRESPPSQLDMIEDTPSHGSHAELTLQNRDLDQVRFVSLWDISRKFRIKVSVRPRALRAPRLDTPDLHRRRPQEVTPRSRGKIMGAENVPIDAGEAVFVEAGLYAARRAAAYAWRARAYRVRAGAHSCPAPRGAGSGSAAGANRYHGGELLCPPLRTNQVRTSGNPRWEEWLSFDIETLNLPRVRAHGLHTFWLRRPSPDPRLIGRLPAGSRLRVRRPRRLHACASASWAAAMPRKIWRPTGPRTCSPWAGSTMS